jgi:amino acid transporter
MYPQRDLPRAVIGTLVIVGELRILCAVALTGMQPYTQLDGFAGAFRANGWEWAAQEVTAV